MNSENKIKNNQTGIFSHMGKITLLSWEFDYMLVDAMDELYTIGVDPRAYRLFYRLIYINYFLLCHCHCHCHCHCLCYCSCNIVADCYCDCHLQARLLQPLSLWALAISQSCWPGVARKGATADLGASVTMWPGGRRPLACRWRSSSGRAESPETGAGPAGGSTIQNWGVK